MTKSVEISEEDFIRSKQLRDVTASILKNPKAKRLLQQAHKLVDPNAVTPDLDEDERSNAAYKELHDRLTAFEKEAKEKEAKAEQDRTLAALNASIDSGIAKLRAAGWTDEGVNGVRELMEKKGILDVEDAAILFEKANPPPPPSTPSGSGSWGFFEMPGDGQDDLKKLIASKGDDESLLRKMTSEALTEVRGGVRR